MPDVPEIIEYITGGEWSLTCNDLDCKWTAQGERTENWMNEMDDVIDQHKQWHEEGMPA